MPSSEHKAPPPRPWLLAVLLSSISWLAVSGCRSEQKVSRDDAIRYYLDQRNYEQAIILLREKLADDPHNDEARIKLASAYSGSVGINTIDCFEVLRPKLFDKPLGKSAGLRTADLELASPLAANTNAGLRAADLELASPLAALNTNEAPAETATEKQQRALRAVEHELLKFTTEAADALDLAFRLPQVAVDQRDRLVLSLAILTEIGEDSPQYSTGQLYQGILAMVQFMNYFRDAIPPKLQSKDGSATWYHDVYCQLDLGVLLPNLSRSIDYLTAALNNLEHANRQSSKPIFTNLLVAKDRLKSLNRTYLRSQDLFEFADWSLRTSKASSCD